MKMYIVTISHNGESHQVVADDYYEDGGFTVFKTDGRELRVNTNKIDFIEDPPRISLLGVIGLVALAAILTPP